MFKRLALASLALMLCQTPSVSAGDLLPRENLKNGKWQFDLGGDYFMATARRDSNGNELEYVDDSQDFKQMQGNLNFSYGFTKSLTVSGGLRFRMINVKNGESDLSISGLERGFVEAQFGGKTSPLMSWRVYAGVGNTLYSNTEHTNTTPDNDLIVLGDHGLDYYAGVGMNYGFSKSLWVSADASLAQPANNLSRESRIDGRLTWMNKSFALYGGGKMVISLKDDEFTDSATGRPRINGINVSGVTNMYNALNREWMAAYGGVRFMTSDKLSIYGEMENRLDGKSTDVGLIISGGLTYRSGGTNNAAIKKGQFKDYIVEATVIKVSRRGLFVLIDQGMNADIERGMNFDIYKTDFFGGNELIASGQVHEVNGETAIVKLVKKYKKGQVQKGFTARGN